MKWLNKRVLLTGGAGFLGSHLLKKLTDLGADITVVDDFSIGSKNNINFFKGEILMLDVSDSRFVHMMEKYDFDFIFHFGSPSSVILFNKDPECAFRKTVSGFLNIMELAFKKQVKKVVWPSSGSVYGVAPPPQSEETDVKPLNLYGIAKFTCEKIAEHYRRVKGVKSTGLRIFAGYGPLEDHKGEIASPITIFLKAIMEGKSPIVFGDGTQSRDFVYIDDIVEVTIKSAEKETPPIVNVGSGKSYTFNEVIDLLNQITGRNIKPKYIPKPIAYLEKTQADITLMKNIFNITPLTLIDGLNRYVQYIHRTRKRALF
jgi:UDP-glucose 4-epimerase